MSIDISNKFMVGTQANDVVFLRPVPKKLSREEALVLAAWLVAVAGNPANEKEFSDLLDKVLNA